MLWIIPFFIYSVLAVIDVSIGRYVHVNHAFVQTQLIALLFFCFGAGLNHIFWEILKSMGLVRAYWLDLLQIVYQQIRSG